MKTVFVSFSLIILTTLQLVVFGQNKHNEQISNSSAPPIEHSGNQDVIILNEKNTIDISGQKLHFIIFSITKKIKFKILNSSGVEQFSNFTLPETFDPTYISHFPEERNYTHVYSKFKCNYFKGTITTKDGEKKEAKIIENIENIKMVMFDMNIYGNYEKYHYHIENLNVGDEVIIEYNYNIPYDKNVYQLSSYRIFFNDNNFKENYELEISHHTDLPIKIDYKNNALPDSVINEDNKKIYYWNKNNLHGCIDEDGAIPYLSLPHIIFSIKPYELLYTLPYSFEEKFIPFYAIYTYQREKNHMGILKSIDQGVRSTQYSQINKFVNTQTQDISHDSIGYLSLLKIQNTIVDEFSFDNDTNYFKQIDLRDPRIGDYISKKTIRDISRYDLYVALISKLSLQYFTAYTCDKRTGEINDDFFIPMWDNDYILAVLLKNNTIHYIYPKKSEYGYYLNEIPFYFENTKARLVNINDYRNYETPIKEESRLITLPNSSIKDNIRRSNILVNINLGTLSTIFKAKIYLSGQYSTLMRGLYQCNHKDKSINKLYQQKIWELNKEVNLINEETKVISKEFPFPTEVNTQYSFKNLLEVNKDTFSLNLKGWFNHVIYKDFNIKYRHLDFYPDFCGQDSYVYYLKFNKNIKLLSSFKNMDIQNDFGELKFSVEQTQANAVKISSFFTVKNSVIAIDKIETVKEIYDKIQNMNNSSLIFTLE